MWVNFHSLLHILQTQMTVCYSSNEGRKKYQEACDYNLERMGLNPGHSVTQRTLLWLNNCSLRSTFPLIMVMTHRVLSASEYDLEQEYTRDLCFGFPSPGCDAMPMGQCSGM